MAIWSGFARVDVREESSDEATSLRTCGPGKAGPARSRRQDPRPLRGRPRHRRGGASTSLARRVAPPRPGEPAAGSRHAASRPCVGAVSKIVAIGLNYRLHAQEAGAAIPSEPIFFMKATSSICGPNDDVIIPKSSQKTDYEVELGIVIGI